ncbi:hypothetical protein [Streptomyces sp. Tue6028]|uniref:hypothetical protein n=1 Tax=Streptomyces sp. Tue6028 TaxID=2036037 RepID=UPI0011809277|nr:hypothetical protein [Streptomyces sp. Tue6028]
MHPTEYPTAWHHPSTRRAWVHHMVLIVVRSVGWVATWLGSLFLVVATPRWIGWAFLLLLVYATFRAVLQLAYLGPSIQIQRVLWQYPWQFLTDVPRGRNKHPGLQDDAMWLELPNPEDPEQRIPLPFLSTMRTFWWMRRFGTTRTKPELKAQIEPLWFAGDPRFVAVVAATGRGGKGPKRLHLLYQRAAAGRRGADPVHWNACPAALERARRAGAHVPESVPPFPRPN